MDRSRENISVAVVYFGFLSVSFTDIYIYYIDTRSIDERMKTTAASARSVNCVRGCAVSVDLDKSKWGT